MRSSRSTPSPSPRPALRLLLLLVGEDHPKACTGRRLVRRGWARPVGRIGENEAKPPVVLDPHAPNPLSRADLPAARAGGLLVVDCSWNRLAARGALPGPAGRSSAIRRRLPILVAANPQHYGRLAELNSAEALAAGLYLLGFPRDAARVLEGFRGGAGFLEVNAERLERYRAAAGPEEIRAAERMLFGAPETEVTGRPSAAVVPSGGGRS